MNIYGNRILLRAIEEKDNEVLKELINDPQIESMVGGWSFPVSTFTQNEWFKNADKNTYHLRCVIEVMETGATVGAGGLSDIDYKNGRAEIHIKILKKYASKGYGAESIHFICKYGFEELRLNSVFANVLEINKASRRMFEKVGFKEEGLMRNRVYKGGTYLNVVPISIFRDELKLYEGNRQ